MLTLDFAVRPADEDPEYFPSDGQEDDSESDADTGDEVDDCAQGASAAARGAHIMCFMLF